MPKSLIFSAQSDNWGQSLADYPGCLIGEKIFPVRLRLGRLTFAQIKRSMLRGPYWMLVFVFLTFILGSAKTPAYGQVGEDDIEFIFSIKDIDDPVSAKPVQV